MKILTIAKRFNKYNLSNFTPIRIGRISIGWVKKENIKFLKQFSDFFLINKNSIMIRSELNTAKKLNSIFDIVISDLTHKKILQKGKNESFPVFNFPSLAIPKKVNFKKPYFRIDRSAIRFFGFRSWGVHLNGFTKRNNDIKIWVGKRNKNKGSYPSKLDNLVGGGQPTGLNPKENLIKESAEEANVKKSLARKAKAVGTINYCVETAEGLCPDTMFIYDLELPKRFIPKCNDNEIENFFLMDDKEVLKRIENDSDFKPNSKLVTLDFLIRKKLLDSKKNKFVNLFYSEINRKF